MGSEGPAAEGWAISSAQLCSGEFWEQVRLPTGPDPSASERNTLKGITMQPKGIARVKR